MDAPRRGSRAGPSGRCNHQEKAVRRGSRAGPSLTRPKRFSGRAVRPVQPSRERRPPTAVPPPREVLGQGRQAGATSESRQKGSPPRKRPRIGFGQGRQAGAISERKAASPRRGSRAGPSGRCNHLKIKATPHGKGLGHRQAGAKVKRKEAPHGEVIRAGPSGRCNPQEKGGPPRSFQGR